VRRPSRSDEEDLLKSLLEWHRWFAWYPVPVVRKGKLRYAWFRFVERKWGTSRYSGTMKWRYRPPTSFTNATDPQIAVNIAKLPSCCKGDDALRQQLQR
jgi:hypothetical protein